MKQLLCVSPSGELEVWYLDDTTWYMDSYSYDEWFPGVYRHHGPEYWGREVLDEWTEVKE